MQSECRPPLAPPPSFTPRHSPALRGTGASFIRQYQFLYVYVLTTGNQAFWMYPTRFDAQFVYCYVWRKEGWTFAKLPIHTIDCVY